MPCTRTRAHHSRAKIVLNQKTIKANTIKHSPGSLNTPAAHKTLLLEKLSTRRPATIKRCPTRGARLRRLLRSAGRCAHVGVDQRDRLALSSAQLREVQPGAEEGPAL